MSLAPEDADSQQARAWAAYHDNRLVEMETAIKDGAPDRARKRREPSSLRSVVRLQPRACRSHGRQSPGGRPQPGSSPLREAPSLTAAPGSWPRHASRSERAVSLDPKFAIAKPGACGRARRERRCGGSPRGVARRGGGSARKRGCALLARPGATGRGSHRCRHHPSTGRSWSSTPSSPEVYYNLAVVYLREKEQPALAAQNFARFLELDPESERGGASLQVLAPLEGLPVGQARVGRAPPRQRCLNLC